MTRAREDAVERTLRWMTENLNGAYIAKHPEGHPRAGYHCTNSGTCILACCYIGALGKVLWKGGPLKGDKQFSRRDFARFQKFLQLCMSDFLTESNTVSLPSLPKGRSGGDELLYKVYRCGFVHGYPSANFAWARNPRSHKYWGNSQGRLTLNIDELVRGFQRGIVEFRRLVAADADLQSRFNEYITAD